MSRLRVIRSEHCMIAMTCNHRDQTCGGLACRLLANKARGHHAHKEPYTCYCDHHEIQPDGCRFPGSRLWSKRIHSSETAWPPVASCFNSEKLFTHDNYQKLPRGTVLVVDIESERFTVAAWYIQPNSPSGFPTTTNLY